MEQGSGPKAGRGQQGLEIHEQQDALQSPGKARKLNYLSQLSVDTAHHVITDIRGYHADGKDNQQLPDIVKRQQSRLWKEGLVWNCYIRLNNKLRDINHEF